MTFMNRKTFIAALLIMVIAAGAASAATVATPAATVNLIRTTIIPKSDLEDAVNAAKAQGYQLSTLEVLQTLIENALLDQGAERAGIVISESEKNQLLALYKTNVVEPQYGSMSDDDFKKLIEGSGMTIEEIKDSLATMQRRRNYVLSAKQSYFTQDALTPTRGEIESYYRKNRSMFANSEAVRIALVIMTKGEDAAENEAKLKTLQDVLSRIQSGKLTFEKAVSAYSEDAASRAQGGEVGWLPIDNEARRALFGEALYDAAFALDDGEIAPQVVDSNIGYVIVKVMRHTPYKMPALDEALSPAYPEVTVAQSISSVLQQDKFENQLKKAAAELIAELTKQARINILYKEAN